MCAGVGSTLYVYALVIASAQRLIDSLETQMTLMQYINRFPVIVLSHIEVLLTNKPKNE